MLVLFPYVFHVKSSNKVHVSLVPRNFTAKQFKQLNGQSATENGQAYEVELTYYRLSASNSN